MWREVRPGMSKLMWSGLQGLWSGNGGEGMQMASIREFSAFCIPSMTILCRVVKH